MAEPAEMVYRIDQRDCIIFVNEAWDRFALANAGESVLSPSVLRRPVWDFICDTTTRQLYRDLLQAIRKGKSVRFPFRCDSPDCRRLLEMNIIAEPEGAVRFQTRTLSLEPREPVVLRRPLLQQAEELLRVCGWCKKIDVNGRWMEIEEAIVHGKLFDLSSLPRQSHGMCETCYGEMSLLISAT